MPSLPSAIRPDIQNIRIGMGQGIGTLIIATIGAALLALWGAMQPWPIAAVLIVLGISAFLGYFAVGMFRVWSARQTVATEARRPSPSSNAIAVAKLNLLRAAGVHFIKNRPLATTGTKEEQVMHALHFHNHTTLWQSMVLEIRSETSGADVEWERFKVLGNVKQADVFSEQLDRLDDIIKKLAGE